MIHRRALAAAAALLALASPAAAQTEVTLTYSSAATGHYGVAAQAFKDYVEKATNGRYRVALRRNDNEREGIESVQLGTQEFAITSSGPLGNFVPEVRVFDIPFLFRDYAHARGVLDSPIGQEILATFPKRGLVGLAWMENGFRHVTTGKREINGPADMKGLKIRTMENPVHMRAFQALGALPTPMAFSELPPALQQGTVDGQENPISVILPNNFNQVQQNLILTGHVYSPGILLASPAFMSKLSAADKAVFQEAAKIAVRTNRDKVEGDERDGVEELRRRGMNVRTDVDRAAFQAAMGSAMQSYEREFGADLLRRIRDWKPAA